MLIVTWILRGLLFLLLVVLALHNTHEAVVRLYFGAEWRAPMMLVVLAAFAFGALCGILALTPRLLSRSKAAKSGQPVEPQVAAPQALPKP
jgi:lipopolysaccharide assembly protein A